jgi:glycosyltransferase involved in cell wall biosynthesis
LPQKIIRIIIPALNEEETITRVIDEIPKTHLEGMGYGVSIIVIDNNSTDRTKQMAESKGVTVVAELRKGKGRAITTAFELVSGDFIFILDADYTYPATYIPQMLQFLESGYDVVLGSRLRGKMEKGAMARLNLLGNHLLTLLANLLYGTSISDLCTGYWGFRGATARDIKLDACGFDLEANLLAQIAQRKCRIAEIPVNYRRRPTPSKLSGFSDGFRIAKTLVEMRFQRK